ncbi:4-hydroxy-tetrahydrodipicolinate synthase [Labrys sp. KNU-23]|uniref:4-hydroxy-tetrahydrodipicolinate synthase n=1 Tax=Labrys sp. KNU-23 TaxID=2789216 RepID=UPI0011EE6E9C|nr:4-hydroxy-tetrahydrodipicolinate synthase [Labrys sp. KNU-23]QEN87314.1 4-hydroxy-tetrahydrodipicolinate synthase [Labrys sp. KNU-23]
MEIPSSANRSQVSPRGLWLPLITPFRDGALDETSLRRLIRHYGMLGLDGLVLAGTTGESLTLDEDETQRLVEVGADELARQGYRLPLYLGLSGSNTSKLAKRLHRLADWPIAGHLIACPYYSRPSQAGLIAHFRVLADSSRQPILIYNIPYRTGVNIGNEAMLQLAERANIVGAKDCCADPAQSAELIRRRPPGFSVLTGEDAFYHAALTAGADGAILASAHVQTASFIAIRDAFARGDEPAAGAAWRSLTDLVPLLFAEPNPAAIKYWLWRTGLIDSGELRLPMTPVSAALAARLDGAIDRMKSAA